MSNKKKKQIRELPISLQGIETILVYMNAKDKEPCSIRNISENTGLSMRVTKNILLQIEKFNQIERVVEKNQILPKWRITKFGKKVINQAQGIQKKTEIPNREAELLRKVTIPSNNEILRKEIKENKDNLVSKLKSMQLDLSKMLGSVLNLNNPAFEHLMSIIINRIKLFSQKISNIPSDPTAIYQLRKKEEKLRKVSKEEIRNLLVELYFFDSLIFNELNLINYYNVRLSQFLENEEESNAYSTARDLREEVRILSKLIYDKEAIKMNSHVLSLEDLNLISKNKINPEILNNIIEFPISVDEQTEGIKKLVLKYISKLNKGEKQLNDYKIELTDNIPLHTFYQLILDENPSYSITIEQLEENINSLAEDGYLPRIKIIQEDEDHYLKLVQFKVQDISKNELKVIKNALKFQSFTVADMVGATEWSTNQVLKTLNHLTELGILKYSKNHLHGDRWYIISEK